MDIDDPWARYEMLEELGSASTSSICARELLLT